MSPPRRARPAAQPDLAAAEAALRRADWQAASDSFRAALARSDSPEGREGLALACFWQGEAQSALEAQEVAYRLYRHEVTAGPRRAWPPGWPSSTQWAAVSYKEIAAALGLSEHTVHRHVGNILTRLDLPSRSAAVAHAAKLGLLKS